MPEAASSRLCPIYIVHGENLHLRRQRRREIVERFVAGADPELVVAHFDASAELAEVLDALRTAPLLAPRRLVIVHDADEFVSAHRRRLEAYLDNPSSAGSLMLLVNSSPANTRLGRMARKAGQVIDCANLADAELPRWLGRAASARGKRITEDAAELLAGWVGNDLARLDSEVEKLALYVGGRRSISAEDVAAVVAATAGAAPFALVDAISSGRAEEALNVLNTMLTRRGEEFRVLGLIGWHLRRRRGPRGRAAGRTARRRSAASGVRRLLATDLALKSGADPLPAMQALVMHLCL
jgi:DNA polymerase-3 subunit delta